MNRKIKFRAWSSDTGMINIDDNSSIVLEFNKISGWNIVPNKVNYGGEYLAGESKAIDFSLMQFTGLKDKNGKEIYESDLVKVKLPDTIKVKGETIKGKIEYDNVGCRYLINQFFDNSYEYDYFQIHEDLIIEVIGNIYENKPS